MSQHQLREEKNCLNCGTIVEDRFCPHCGQENTVNRPSFHYLFTHFFEDLFHYDNGFWKTMKSLLFRPGIMVKEYLKGKRKSYVPPVKLYIFISFVTFFIPFLLPDFEEQPEKAEPKKVSEVLEEEKFEGINIAGVKNVKTIEQLDSIQDNLPEDKKLTDIEYNVYKSTLRAIAQNQQDSAVDGNKGFDVNIDSGSSFFNFTKDGISLGKYRKVKTVEQLDSIHRLLPEKDRMNWASKMIFKKMVEYREREIESGENMTKEFGEAFVHNLPKALFVYLPFFAFFLWLLHNKKRWLYYDHGIFTLYYFSFLLILITLNILITWILMAIVEWVPLLDNIFTLIALLIVFFSLGYAFFYFFRAHSRVYEERKLISRTKGFLLFWVNSFFIFLILMIYTILTFLMI